MKKSLIILSSLFIVFTSCKKEYDVQMNQNVKVNIQGYVYNNATAEAIPNAIISWPSGSATSNANGFFSLGSVNPGSITITIEADSFASMFYTLDMDANTNSNTYTESMIIYMYKLDQTLRTRIFENVGELYRPVSNVPYQIDLGYGFLDRIIKGVTNADGEIEQANLPDANVQLRVDFEQNGVKYGIDNYSGYTTGYPKSFSSAVLISEIENTGSLLVTATNVLDDKGKEVSDFTCTDNITFEFTTSIDVEYSNNSVELIKSDHEVASEITWSNDNKALTINPIGDSLEIGEAYYVRLRLISEDGAYLNNYSGYHSYYFVVEGTSSAVELGKVSAITLDYPGTISSNTTNVRISFPEVENAYYYEVYGSYDNNEYLFLDDFYSSPGLDGMITTSYIYLTNLPDIVVPAGGLFANGRTYKLIVRAVGSGYSEFGPYSDPFVLRVE